MTQYKPFADYEKALEYLVRYFQKETTVAKDTLDALQYEATNFDVGQFNIKSVEDVKKAISALTQAVNSAVNSVQVNPLKAAAKSK